MKTDNFQRWLVAAGKAPSTAVLYSYYAKRILRDCHDAPTAAGVEMAIQSIPEDRRRSASAAWAAFVAYAKAKGTELPGVREAKPSAGPPALAAILLDLSKSVPSHFLPELRWNRIRLLGDGTAEVYTGGGEHHWYAPVDLLKRLKAEVKPKGKVAPLVPTHEGEVDKSMSARQIARLIERAEIENEKKAAAAATATTGAAAAAPAAPVTPLD